MSHVAKRYGYTRPTLTQENVLYVVNGRHPLQELCVEQFIPNSISLAAGMHAVVVPTCVALTGSLLWLWLMTAREGAVKIITGPNYSGSCSLSLSLSLSLTNAELSPDL